jgi:GNAT superfamily N-acetyltransferase
MIYLERDAHVPDRLGAPQETPEEAGVDGQHAERGGIPEDLLQAIADATAEAFPGYDPGDGTYGVTEDVLIAPSLSDLLRSEGTVVSVLVGPDGKLIGYSCAIPIERMDPSRGDEAGVTAYVYFTVVVPEHRGRGYASQINVALDDFLRREGYRFVELDARIGNGYAEKIQRAYGAAIVSHDEHEDYPEFGRQVHFRIDLEAATGNMRQSGNQEEPKDSNDST